MKELRLSGEYVNLRPLTRADCGAVLEAVRESQPSLGLWLDWATPEYGVSDASEYLQYCLLAWKSSTAYPFGVFGAAGELLGTVECDCVARKVASANIGYWVRSSAQRRGVALAAVRLVRDFAFTHLRLTRLEIACHPDNAASRKVAERAGGHLECIAANRIIFKGAPTDAALYCLKPDVS